MKPTLFIFSGLPGTGKTTLSKLLAQTCKAAYFRLDTLEHGLHEICGIKVGGEGYGLAYRMVKDNLENGMNVIVDCCNPINLTRKEWKEVAMSGNARCVNIEVCCSDADEHKRRVENRQNDIAGFVLPSWDDVVSRQYDEWKQELMKIDTANKTVEICMDEIIGHLKKMGIA